MPRRDIVVIGGSAGGIEAISSLLASLPPSFPAAICVVIHIPAYAVSVLAELFTYRCNLPVAQATDGLPLLPGHVYVAPPDHHLMVEDRYVRITRGPKENRFRPSVDVLFRSAAYSFGQRVIAVLVSGMLSDGTAGMWAVKDRGGITIAQDTNEALHSEMPTSAVAHDVVDYQVPIAEMSALLMRLTSETIMLHEDMAMSERLRIETQIAREDCALDQGVTQLGSPSLYTCPECHGVLIQINEGKMIRYRCHTGHAYSRASLLASVQESVEETLWSTIRVIEEKLMLLRQFEADAGGKDDQEAIDHNEFAIIRAQMDKLVQQRDELRAIVLS